MYKGEPLRLIGVSLSNLELDETTQLNIFENFNEKEHKLDKTVDTILNKFGNNHLITRASLIHSDKNLKPYFSIHDIIISKDKLDEIWK